MRDALESAQIEVRSVTKRYPMRQAPALHDIDLEVLDGEFLILMGPSGSGKSTLLNLIGGLDEASEGTIEVAGHELHELDDQGLTRFRRENVGFVFQTFHLIASLTALENVLTPILSLRKNRADTARAMRALDSVGLEGKERQLPGELSGGEQQRVAIARALITEPRVLLADEPTGNLDAATGTEVMDLIARLQRETGMTVVLATHDPDVASRGERVVILRDGAVTAMTDVAPGETGGALTARLATLAAPAS